MTKLAAIALAASILFSRPAGRADGRACPLAAHGSSRIVAVGPTYPLVAVVPVTVVGAPARTASKAWSCGPVEANLVGGSQRTCGWR